MVNTRKKGNKNRRKTIEALENEGWEVGVVERTGRFIFPKDLFGLFDLVAVRGKEVSFIQVSTNRPHPHIHFRKFRKKIKGNPTILEQWCWIDRKGVKKWQY